jgi:hypothetical protein
MQDQKCQMCNGGGKVQYAGGNVATCPVCNGSGAQPGEATPYFYDYVFDAVVPLNGVFSVTKQLATDSGFECIFFVASRTSALLTIQVIDSSRGSQSLSDNPVNIDNWAGTAQNPFPLVYAYYFPPGTSITMKFTDTSGAQNTVEVVMRGHKLFPKTPVGSAA